MGFEPQKLFIGLVDFFSILMPGALLAYRLKDWAALKFGHADGFPLEGGEHLAVFLFASYLLGHFVFLIGSFLDDLVYDRLRKTTSWGQIRRLAESRQLYPAWIRRLSSKVLFGRDADAAVMKAQHIKALALEPLSGADAINTYQWCKARLAKELPEGLVTVQRFEADSKFFRSFFVVLVVLIFTFLRSQHRFLLISICLVLLVPAFLRYFDQRFKGTQQAYWLVITLESLGAPTRRSHHGAGRSDKLTHAGGLVTRLENGVKEYLLVQATGNREEWVLPKGHIEPGEHPRETAVREVLEETGCWARVIERDEDLRMGHDSVVRIYRMEWLEDVERSAKEQDRPYEWKRGQEAMARASFKDTRRLIEADMKRKPAPSRIEESNA